MKLAIVGSRSLYQVSSVDIQGFINAAFEGNVPEITEIVSGGAEGIDTAAEKYADEHYLSKHIIRPQWKKFGKSAGYKRNVLIVEAADKVLVIWDSKSRGAKQTAERAMAKNKLLCILEVSQKRHENPYLETYSELRKGKKLETGQDDSPHKAWIRAKEMEIEAGIHTDEDEDTKPLSVIERKK